MGINLAASAKSVVSSWTVWLNAATLAFIIAALMLPDVAALIPANWQPYVVAFIAVGNLFLRIVRTSQPIDRLY